VSIDCPADDFVPGGTECRGLAGVCDVAETCDGASAACPADAKSTTECRAAAGVCDAAESCDGVNDDCPADAVAPTGTVCRAGNGACDAAETCDGTDVSCPGDVLAAAGTVCRATAGGCDVEETCSGSDPGCPADVFASGGTVCRASGGVCDVAETCSGSTASCPVDQKLTTECRASSGVCDVAESCDGVTDACPADAFVASGTECRAAAGVCDLAETCSGSSGACPVDGKSTAECRAASDLCDLAESCDGVGDDCPADVLAGAGDVCRPAANSCDVEETCDGVTASCPTDVTDDADGDAVCDENDNCPQNADPSQADGDGDGKGDACDPCNNIYDIFAQKARIKLTKLTTVPGAQGLGFKGTLDGMPLEPTIDPVANGVRVIIDNGSPIGAIVDVIVPGGAGWKANKKGTSFKYGNKTGFEGITKVKIKLPKKTPGRVKFNVKGKNLAFANVDPANMVGTLIIHSPIAVDGQCGEAVFPNTAGGVCKANKKGSTLKCK
jgi:hypothetical protein